MVCRKCGATIKEEDLFCSRCGSRTEKAEHSFVGYLQTEERTIICQHCGKRIPEKSVGCPYCGKIISKQYSRPSSDYYHKNDSGTGWGILGFLFPLLGLILYLVWKEDYPNRASSVGAGAIVGFVISILISIISFFIVYFSV